MTAATPVRHSCEFGPIDVDYDERVLVPRPWTLQQSRWAADLAPFAAGPLLELCAGAGQIGLAAAVLADRDLVQVEADPVAAGYASFNAERAGRAQRVEVRTSRLQTALRPDETFALILADPPYLPTEQIERWPHDPPTAINGGADGLDVVKDCLAIARAHLGAPGWVLLQVAGPAQARRVDGMLRAQPEWGLRSVELRIEDDERAVMLVART